MFALDGHRPVIRTNRVRRTLNAILQGELFRDVSHYRNFTTRITCKKMASGINDGHFHDCERSDRLVLLSPYAENSVL